MSSTSTRCVLLLVLAVAGAGCLDFAVAPGALRCDSQRSRPCPLDWTCRVNEADGRHGRCYPPGGSGPDAPLVVRPAYSSAPDWMDHVRRGARSRPHHEQPDEPCDPVADEQIGDCLHGGELRRVQTTLSSCDGLEIRDELDALQWRCDLAEQHAVLHSTGLQETASLADLLEGAAFKQNRVLVRRAGELVAASEPAVWWQNPVRPLPPPGDDTAPVALEGPGTIYTARGEIEVDTYEIADDRVAVVVAEGATLWLREGRSHCPAGQAKHRCLLLVGPRRFVWIEGHLRTRSSGAAWGVRATGARYLRLRRVRVGGFWLAGVSGDDLHTARLERVSAHDSRRGGVNVGAWQSVLWRVSAAANGDPSNTGEAGLTLRQGSGNVIVEAVATSNQEYGVRFGDAARANTLGLSTTAHNGYSGVTLAGGGSSTIFSLLSVGSATGPGLGVRSPQNLLAASAIGHGDRGVARYNKASVSLTGDVVLAANRKDCAIGDGAPLDCATLGDARLRSAASLAATVRGKVDEDDADNGSDNAGAAKRSAIGDWLSFEDRHRSWGADGSDAFADPSNAGLCQQDCRIWDWRLGADPQQLRPRRGRSDAADLDEVEPGQPCPAPAHGDQALTDKSGNTFLIHARELLGDALGDDDGLCESNERCLYQPYAGSAQGGERVGDAMCVFADGEVEGVALVGLSR